jgi:hypothetical protein
MFDGPGEPARRLPESAGGGKKAEEIDAKGARYQLLQKSRPLRQRLERPPGAKFRAPAFEPMLPPRLHLSRGYSRRHIGIRIEIRILIEESGVRVSIFRRRAKPG